MTRPNTDRRKNALWGAVSTTVLRLVAAAVLLWCRRDVDSAALSVFLLVIALVNLGTIVPIWINFRIRLSKTIPRFWTIEEQSKSIEFLVIKAYPFVK